MVSTEEAFISLDMLKGPPIVLGDDSLTESFGKGRIDFDHGKFSNVLYVPGLASNLLLVYQMTHIGSPKKFIFFADEVEITEISSGVLDNFTSPGESHLYGLPLSLCRLLRPVGPFFSFDVS